MDTSALDATPEQLTGAGIFHIDRQRAFKPRIVVPAAPAAPAAIVRPISNPRIRTPAIAVWAVVAGFHLKGSSRDDIDVRVFSDMPHPSTLELSGNSGIRALAHERTVVRGRFRRDRIHRWCGLECECPDGSEVDAAPVVVAVLRQSGCG